MRRRSAVAVTESSHGEVHVVLSPARSVDTHVVRYPSTPHEDRKTPPVHLRIKHPTPTGNGTRRRHVCPTWWSPASPAVSPPYTS